MKGASWRHVAFAILMAGTQVSAQQPAPSTIPNQLREGANIERVIVSESEPLQLADLAGQAELVVEATTTGGGSYLSKPETDIFTDYPFQVREIIKNRRRPELRLGDLITVRRNSGNVVVDGHVAVVHENDFPFFTPEQRYILFLVKLHNEDAYTVYGGPQGAFTVGDGVSQLATDLGQWSRTTGPVTRLAFLGELRALLRFSTN